MSEQDETRHRVSAAPQKGANPNFVDLIQEEGARSHALPHLFARGVLPFTRRSALKARRSLHGYPAGSRVGSTAFPAGGAGGIVRERSCSGATPDDNVLRDRN
jgi:hypothetical protein